VRVQEREGEREGVLKQKGGEGVGGGCEEKVKWYIKVFP
jgi:hypothetical protein